MEDPELDFEEDLETGENVSNAALRDISQLAEEEVELEEEVARLEQSLKDKKRELSFLQEVRLPEAMDNINMQHFALADGTAIEVKQVTKASIPSRHREAAIQWLRDNGYGALVKRKLALTFGKGQDEVADEVVRYLQEQMQLNADDKPEVHHQTLTAFVKEQQAKGVQLPEDLLGVYNARKAEIKRPKK